MSWSWRFIASRCCIWESRKWAAKARDWCAEGSPSTLAVSNYQILYLTPILRAKKNKRNELIVHPWISMRLKPSVSKLKPNMNFNNWKLVYSELVKKKTLLKAKPQQQTSEVSRILESFRFWDEHDYEYEIFPIPESLSNNVFDGRTSTGSGLFELFIR